MAWEMEGTLFNNSVSGESGGVNIEDVTDFKARIPEFVGNYH